jgi:hypothetical protein
MADPRDTRESVQETLALYELLLGGDDSDLMTGDIRAEIEGTS